MTEENEMLAMPGSIEALLKEVGFWYQQGRQDAGETGPYPKSDWAEVYARLMIGTEGSLGTVGINRIYDAWRTEQLHEWIVANALTEEQRDLALAALAPPVHDMTWVVRRSLTWQTGCSCGWLSSPQVMERDAAHAWERHNAEATS